jgi:pSer/pThr/pTyr-binding forkhead associated (FHA) protein
VGRLEILRPHGPEFVELEGDKILVGTSKDADIAIDHDPTVSRRHAILERVGATWSIQDYGSTNGTYVNGQREFGTCQLRDKDEIMLGRTRLIYRVQAVDPESSTEVVDSAPAITPREREVLIELCRPRLSGNDFTPPATVREIADKLCIGESAVKNHLERLYDKFFIDPGPDRRARVANAALRTGTIGFRDLQ